MSACMGRDVAAMAEHAAARDRVDPVAHEGPRRRSPGREYGRAQPRRDPLPQPLVPRPVDTLTHTSQHFKCHPYDATIPAGTCLARQAVHGQRWVWDNRGGHPNRPAREGQTKGTFIRDMGKCNGCELGKLVRLRLNAADVAAVTEDA